MEPSRAPPCPSEVLSNGARAGLVVAAMGLALGGCLGPATPPADDANELATSEAPTTLPSDSQLLLYTNVGPVILREGVDDPIRTPESSPSASWLGKSVETRRLRPSVRHDQGRGSADLSDHPRDLSDAWTRHESAPEKPSPGLATVLRSSGPSES